MLFTVALLAVFSSCNVAKDQLEDKQGTVEAVGAKSTDNAQNRTSYAEFSQMSVEEQWQSLSPNRRNYLRENPDLYPRFADLIAAEPAMEQAPPIQQMNNPPESSVPQESTPGTPQEWWDTFSESRKQYMREHIEQYPDFQDIIESETETDGE